MEATLKRLLIVDDCAEDRAYARDLMKNQLSNWQCSEASTGREGLELASSGGPFDCILLDYLLPDLTGIEFLNMLSERIGEPGVPTVLFTGVGDEEMAVRAMKAGADHYLSKGGLSREGLFYALENAIEHFEVRLSRHRISKLLERANEELKRSNEDLERFAFAVSHDLKSPIRTVSLCAQLLANRCDAADAEASELSQIIQSNAKRAAELIEDLLTHARLGSQDDIAGVKTGQVSQLEEGVRSAVESLKGELRETGAEIVYGSLPSVVVSKTHLAQVFQNLIENAVKYRRPTVIPRIEISAQEQGGQWVIAVEDNGQGFEPDYADVIFQPFKRLHGTEYPGSGIGLATCRKIVERNGGRIWAKSTPNAGSTFYFCLPAVGTYATAG